MDIHTITIVVAGLSGVASIFAGLMFAWLRDDIRNLATAQASLQEKFDRHSSDFQRIYGQLEGKGIVSK